VQGTDGAFYETTGVGATDTSCVTAMGCGTIFSLGVGLSPAVEVKNDFGIVDANVVVLGNNLTAVTAVSFNRTAAISAIHSPTDTTGFFTLEQVLFVIPRVTLRLDGWL
jgi:hypothetical protein